MTADETLAGPPDQAPVAAGVSIRPAHLFLVDEDLAAQVAAPAYDTLPQAERDEIARNNPQSFLNAIMSPAIDAVEREQDDILRTNKAALEAMLAEGVFAPVEAPALALYRLGTADHVQTGIVAAVAVADYDEGRIRPHELTRSQREKMLARYLEAVGVASSPIALAYRHRPALARIIERTVSAEPTMAFTSDDGLEQTVWLITEPALITSMVAEFEQIDRMYVTDGHHRLAAASRHAAGQRGPGGTATARSNEPWDYFLAVLFPDDQLRVDSFHRIVRRPAGSTSDDILAAIARCAVVTPQNRVIRPARHRFSMFLADMWHSVDVGASVPAGPVDALDATMLQELILGPVFGIEDPRSDPHIELVPASDNVRELERRCRRHGEAVFLLHPPSLDDLMTVADAGGVMPPKSTWFHPKPRSGIFLRFCS